MGRKQSNTSVHFWPNAVCHRGQQPAISGHPQAHSFEVSSDETIQKYFQGTTSPISSLPPKSAVVLHSEGRFEEKANG